MRYLLGGAVFVGGVVVLVSQLRRMEKRLVALNQQQSDDLLAAVGQLSTDVQELADRLEGAVVSDDPVVASVITELRSLGTRVDSIAATPAEPPSPTGSGSELPPNPVEPPVTGF